MNRYPIMIYGAYGYTGELIARTALARGHRPLLAGRDRDRLERLGAELSLETLTLSLDDAEALARALQMVDVVCHTAGPFVHTCEPMLEACLASKTSYLDITGEIPALERVFESHERARHQGIVLLPAVGFDVVPTDCLARFVADRLPDARELEIAFAMESGPSVGTAKASFEGLLRGNYVRRDGVLERIELGQGVREQRFADRTRTVMPIPWGDLVSAFRTTAIPNITTYMAVPGRQARALQRAAPVNKVAMPLMRRALGFSPVRTAALRAIESFVQSPSSEMRQTGRAQVWARATNHEGQQCEAWLQTPEGYAFTQQSALLAIERVLGSSLSGALTPAMAFGPDFVLEIDGVTRHESL